MLSVIFISIYLFISQIKMVNNYVILLNKYLLLYYYNIITYPYKKIFCNICKNSMNLIYLQKYNEKSKQLQSFMIINSHKYNIQSTFSIVTSIIVTFYY